MVTILLTGPPPCARGRGIEGEEAIPIPGLPVESIGTGHALGYSPTALWAWDAGGQRRGDACVLPLEGAHKVRPYCRVPQRLKPGEEKL